MNSDYILSMKGISKSFPGVKALDKVQLDVRKGTVHALMGENGAGKSTLMKILIGINPKDEGEIFFDGKQIEIKNTNFALHNGISMIFQELNPIPNMTVAENIYIGREPKKEKSVFLDKKKMTKDTEGLLKNLKINIDSKEKLSDLSVAQTQMIEIAKAISYNSKLIIMDEPTSAITEKECDHLFQIVKELREKGVSFIFITHKMDEVFQIADDITIFRDGQYISTERAENLNNQKLIELMVGREITHMFPKEEIPLGKVVMSVKGLGRKGVFQDVNFELKKGEILGFAGLMGAGRTEVMEAIFGYKKADSGTVELNGQVVDFKTPKEAIAAKVALITEDRKLTGLFLPLSVRDNMMMPSLRDFSKFGFLKKKRIEKTCIEGKEWFSIKTPSMNQKIKNLSGGNQQKVIISRWVVTDPQIIILDEPTRGIDVGAKSEIHKFMTNLVKQGKSVIMISSELPEVLGMSDRIVVMHEGRVTGILDGKDATQERVMEYATAVANK